MLTVVAIMTLEEPQGANAFGTCNASPNWYADQHTNQLYTGVAGWFYTYQPSTNTALHQYSASHLYTNTALHQYSASHLYPYRDGGSTFSEIGWVKGWRPSQVLTSSTFYTAMAEPGVTYSERTFSAAPAGFVAYKIQNIGFDNTTNKWQWGIYYTDFNNPKWVWEMAAMNWAQGLSGGEVSRSSGTQMQVRMVPSHQLLLPSDGQWHDWNLALMSLNNDTTTPCNDTGFVISYNVYYDDYQASGTSP